MNDFTKGLVTKLTVEKGLTDSTAKQYIRSLNIANCHLPFSSIGFLRNIKQVEECLKPYKPNTQKSILTAIVSVLKCMKMDKLYQKYLAKLMALPQAPSNVKSETQSENWMDWKEVEALRSDLHAKLGSWESRLKYMVLCLYTQTQPRRNMDYLLMNVVRKHAKDLPSTHNYLSLEDEAFVFNTFKTSKHYGQQVIPIPDELKETIVDYLSHHPLRTQDNYAFLVNASGKRFETSGAITRLLNSVFHKKVGASMLRHIYLSNKYDLKEMKEDAENMAHSLNQQRDYIMVE